MSYLIKDLPSEEKPREKAKQHGIQSLSNAELLSILFRTGKKDKSVMDLSMEVLHKFHGLENIQDLRYASLSSIKGIGEVKALTLLAALELGKRVYFKEEQEQIHIQNSEDVYRYYHHLFDGETQEKMMCLFLNNKNYVLEKKVIFIGTVSQSPVHPRDIFREAMLNNASKIICIHNHPSGFPEPSLEDRKITAKLKKVGETIGIDLADHIIIGKSSYYSFLEHGDVFA